jgi:hypothetical protein
MAARLNPFVDYSIDGRLARGLPRLKNGQNEGNSRRSFDLLTVTGRKNEAKVVPTGAVGEIVRPVGAFCRSSRS